MKTAKQINTPQIGQVTLAPISKEQSEAMKNQFRDGSVKLEALALTTDQLLGRILDELRAIREQLKTVIDDKNGAACVVTRDKFR